MNPKSSLLLLALIAVTTGSPLSAAETARKPNLVLVVADDLGWGDIGYHGSQAKTPNIDRISSEGLRFDRFYAQPICTPTRAALMTGRYPWRTGMASGVILNHLHYGLPLDETTLAQTLKKAGYTTDIVGKWHLGHETPAYLPTERGFDYHYGLYTAIDHFTHMWQGGLDWHRNRKAVREEGYASDLIGDDCVRLIKEHDFSKSPLFLYNPMFAVHSYNQAPEKYTADYADENNSDRRGLMGLCAAMDFQFGRIIEALKDAGQLDNTLVFFFSDNGGNMHASACNSPLREGKGTYYEGGIRVPAFAYWPGKIEAGKTTDAFAYVADIYPTFAALAGAPLPAKPLDGINLAPILFNHATSSGRKEIPFMLEDSERLRRGAITEWPWKLLRTAKPQEEWSFELYNIATDPGEKTDVSKGNPEIVQRLSARLDELKKDAPPAFWTPNSSKIPKGWKPSPIIGPDQE